MVGLLLIGIPGLFGVYLYEWMVTFCVEDKIFDCSFYEGHPFEYFLDVDILWE